MSSSDTIDARRLLEDSSWLRQLARQLVRDPASADDAVQKTLLVLARKPRASRAWLTSVLRNAIFQDRRARIRRGRIEARGAKPSASVSTEDIVARLEIQRRLIDAVEALDEPYRTTIALRFLESRPPREVAKRMGTPVKTVHTRIERGLAKLRAKLDGLYRGRGEWRSILAPLTFRRAALGLPGLGVLLVSTTVKWTASAVALVVLGGVLQRSLSPAELPSQTSETDVAVAPPTAVAAELEPAGMAAGVDSDRRVAVPGPKPEVPAAPAVPRFEGRVVDTEGRPVGGITVHFQGIDGQTPDPDEEQITAESDRSGVFEMVLPTERGRLVGRGRGVATVVSPSMDTRMPAEPPRVVVGPERSYSGVVLDEKGVRLAGVVVAVRLAKDVSDRLTPGGLAQAVPVARTQTIADGSFVLARIGFAKGSALRAERVGYKVFSMELPVHSRSDLECTLLRVRRTANAVAGHVLDQNGVPVEGARVSAGQSTTVSDAHGAFVLELQKRAGKVLRAVAVGWLPGSIDLATVDAADHGSLELRLGPAGRTITGRVIDHEGKPIADAMVWTFDGEHFGYVPRRMGDLKISFSKDVEQMVAGGDRDGREAQTDPDGRFELASLVDRQYGLFAMHPVTLAIGRAPAVSAGARGVSIILSADERTAVVAGRVLNYGGAPVVGALIRVNRRVTVADGKTRFRGAGRDFYQKTDATGGFRFAELAVEGTALLLNGKMITAAQTIPLDEVSDLTQVEFRVPARAHLRIHLESDPGLATGFTLLDAKGKKLNISFVRGGVTLGAQPASISEGVSPLIQTDESARTLVLYGSRGMEVRRQPIKLKAGEVNEIRL